MTGGAGGDSAPAPISRTQDLPFNDERPPEVREERESREPPRHEERPSSSEERRPDVAAAGSDAQSNEPRRVVWTSSPSDTTRGPGRDD